MQIDMKDNKRVDFHGNAIEGVWIDLVNNNGVTYEYRKLSESERQTLLDTLTRKDNGRAV